MTLETSLKVRQLNPSWNILKNLLFKVKFEIYTLICIFLFSVYQHFLQNIYYTGYLLLCFALEYIILDFTFLDPSVPGVFSSSSPIRLEKLSLSSNSLKILRPGYLSNLTVLEHLDLSHNKLTDVNSRQFQELNLLKSLDISYNELSEFNYTTVNSLVR